LAIGRNVVKKGSSYLTRIEYPDDKVPFLFLSGIFTTKSFPFLIELYLLHLPPFHQKGF